MKKELNLLLEEKYIYGIETIARKKHNDINDLLFDIDRKKFSFISMGCQNKEITNFALDILDAINIMKENIPKDGEL